MNDKLMRNCVYCQTEKVCVDSGRKLKDGSRVYVNSQGIRWAGRRCPECERKRVKAALKQDSFERQLVLDHLKEAGYEVLSSTYPLRVRSADQQEQTVGIQYASITDRGVALGERLFPEAEMFALVVQSIRLCHGAQLQRMQTAKFLGRNDSASSVAVLETVIP